MYTGRLIVTPKNGMFNMPAGTALTLQYDRYDATTGFVAGIFTAGLPDSAAVTLLQSRLTASVLVGAARSAGAASPRQDRTTRGPFAT